ncbi:Histone deacetylation Rxt3 protein [Rutstroemia sp. NJR-2017a WRK4]|nr:Histone deacetylation Rxt3 protein [Rutstroemia sp. NJR-2017a WRK4]
MDPRQPQHHPFSRGTSSPYGRTPFPPTANQQPYPPGSHPPSNAPSYADHQRRPSDGPFYTPRNYSQDGAPMPGGGHSRHPSSSSIGHGTPVNRNMPPPSSPQQPPSQQPQQHGYGPPHPRAPPVSVGPPSAFPSNRELPTLPPLGRPPSTAGSSMSISSMLGGPAPANREPMSAQYPSPIGTSAQPPPMYSNAPHASPRVSSTAPDYAPYRRPQTPERQRAFETRGHRANSAGSPPGAGGQYGTPDSRRFGTPQTYGQRPPPGQMVQQQDDRRESQPMRVTNMGVPPRPSSQPTAFNPPISRPPDRGPVANEGQFGRRMETNGRSMENLTRGEPVYQRPQGGFDDRHGQAYEYMERERMQRDREKEAIIRDREMQERARPAAMNEPMRPGMNQEYPHQIAQRDPQATYNRPPEHREQPAWMRSGYDQPRPGYEQPQYDRPPPQQSHPPNGYDYPRSSAPQYQGHPAYAPEPHDPRDPRDSRDPRDPRYSRAPQPTSAPGSHYEPRYDERLERAAPPHQQQAARQQQSEAQKHPMQGRQVMYGGPEPGAPYQINGSPQRRPIEEAPQMQQQQSQRSFLSVQENRRGGRLSPIPQAVQGAQVQQPGPAGEPGIKSEFGKIFHGIGSGVGASMSMPSPIPGTSAGMPFSNAARREDLENPSTQNSPVENGGHMIARTSSLGGRRRKLKEEDRADDESSTGRQTPTGRAKRAKHPAHRHHHHHRPEPLEHIQLPAQQLTPFKTTKGNNSNVSPPSEERSAPHHHVRHHHHHHSSAPKPAQQPVNTIIRIPKLEVRSQSVLEEASHFPRSHLGFEYYQANLKPRRAADPVPHPSQCGFASTNKAIPNFEGRVNCTYTIKVPRIHLTPKSREEITRRRAVWGTDVYSDDSDIIAACIHQGWFCGKWHESVDIKYLGLELVDEGISMMEPETDTVATGPDETLSDPPPKGPMPVPSNRDLHVEILILPALEKYSSTTRFGIKSREWGGKNTTAHDGLSYMIMKIKWVDGVDGMEGGSRVARKKMMMRRLREDEAEREAWEERQLNGNGKRANSRDEDERMEEVSFERGKEPELLNEGEINGVGTKSWWKEDKSRKSRAGADTAKVAAEVSEKPPQDTEMTLDGPSTAPVESVKEASPAPPAPEPMVVDSAPHVSAPEPQLQPEPQSEPEAESELQPQSIETSAPQGEPAVETETENTVEEPAVAPAPIPTENDLAKEAETIAEAIASLRGSVEVPNPVVLAPALASSPREEQQAEQPVEVLAKQEGDVAVSVLVVEAETAPAPAPKSEDIVPAPAAAETEPTAPVAEQEPEVKEEKAPEQTTEMAG